MNNLKKIRIARGLTQYEIAEFINVSQVVYSKYETGKSEPSYDTLTKLANYFDVSVDYLLDYNETALIIPDELKDVSFAFYKSEGEELEQEDIDELAKYIEFIKSKKE